jgi:glycerol-3-phosphate O-acyltransferase
MMLRVENLSRESPESESDLSLGVEPLLHPEWTSPPEGSKTAWRDVEIRLEKPLELQEGLLIEDHGVERAGRDPRFRQTVLSGIAREPFVTLHPCKALFLGRRDDRVASQETGGAVVIECRDAENVPASQTGALALFSAFFPGAGSSWLGCGRFARANYSAKIPMRRWIDRIAIRAFRDSRSRLDRFKLTRKGVIREMLLDDPHIAGAVKEHAIEHRLSEGDTWRHVESYIEEIVPFFNILSYYKLGLIVSRGVLSLFYKVSAEFAESAQIALPKDSIVIYLMNHRSNADYLLAGYVLSGRVAISYAVGEWARTFPLEYIFKSFGAYFVRRKYREHLYHTVLERYVQLITRNGVTQGIFLEGGLSRDGKIGKAKIGLLDYVLGVGRDRSLRPKLYIVPVAINYDRVLEDRSLLRELDAREGRSRPPRHTQLAEVARYVWWNSARLVLRRWKRYGRAAAVIGEPIALAPWFESQDREIGDLFAIPRSERLARVQQLADIALHKIAEIIPVTPVCLACAAIQSFDGDFIAHEKLVERMREMRDVLKALNARMINYDGSPEETFDRAWRMLRMRRILVRSGNGYAVLPMNRPLVSYYANSVAHLLGPFAEGVRERDALPGLMVAR